MTRRQHLRNAALVWVMLGACGVLYWHFIGHVGGVYLVVGIALLAGARTYWRAAANAAE